MPVLLDLIDALDTVDHDISISWLKTRFGISCKIFECFRSYVKDRKRFVEINSQRSYLRWLKQWRCFLGVCFKVRGRGGDGGCSVFTIWRHLWKILPDHTSFTFLILCRVQASVSSLQNGFNWRNICLHSFCHVTLFWGWWTICRRLSLKVTLIIKRIHLLSTQEGTFI